MEDENDLTTDTFDWLIKKLNEPPKPLPKLKKLLERKPIWKD